MGQVLTFFSHKMDNGAIYFSEGLIFVAFLVLVRLLFSNTEDDKHNNIFYFAVSYHIKSYNTRGSLKHGSADCRTFHLLVSHEQYCFCVTDRYSFEE